MDNENKERSNLKEKLSQEYRLVAMKQDTFEEVRAYNLTLKSIYLIAAGILGLTCLLCILLISFTPLRKLIPGYGDIREHKEIYQLYTQIEAMEEELESHRTYSESFKRILVGDAETEEQIQSEIPETIPDSLLNISRIKEDSLLRSEIEQDLKSQNQSSRTNKGAFAQNLSLEQMLFIPPISGSISEGYMPDKKHYGLDVMAPKNTPIKAIMDGFVITSDWTLETGNTLGIQHANNVISFYKHNSALLKKSGDFVKAGEAIAIIGNTGTLSSGPHLHFELWHDGKPVDPSKYIQF